MEKNISNTQESRETSRQVWRIQLRRVRWIHAPKPVAQLHGQQHWSDPIQSNWAFSPSVCGAVGFVEVMSPSHSFIQHWYFCLGTKYTGVCERSPMEMKAPGL